MVCSMIVTSLIPRPLVRFLLRGSGNETRYSLDQNVYRGEGDWRSACVEDCVEDCVPLCVCVCVWGGGGGGG